MGLTWYLLVLLCIPLLVNETKPVFLCLLVLTAMNVRVSWSYFLLYTGRRFWLICENTQNVWMCLLG